MDQVTVRKAEIGDAEQVAALVNAAYRPAPGSGGWTHEAALVSGARIDLAQVCRTIEGSTVLVAVGDVQLLGCVQVKAEGRESHIGLLAVLPTVQAEGLGKKLLAEAEDYAQSSFGAQLFVLFVVEQRRELINFYLRRGYQETGEFQTYPVNSGVGTPFNADARLAVLHKRSGEHNQGRCHVEE